MMRVWRLSVAYIGPKSRTESPRKTKIGIEVVHVTCDSDTTFKVKRSKVNLQGAGAYCGGVPHRLSIVVVLCWADGVDGDRVGQLAVITRSNFVLFKEAVARCVYSDTDVKIAFAGVGFLC